jgi:hypothetical protein
MSAPATITSERTVMTEFVQSPSFISEADLTITPGSERVILSTGKHLFQNVEAYQSKIFPTSYKTQTKARTPVEVFTEEIRDFFTYYVYTFEILFVSPAADASCYQTCTICVLATARDNVTVSDPTNVTHVVTRDSGLETTQFYAEYNQDSSSLTFFVVGNERFEALDVGVSHILKRITSKV